MPLLCLDDDFAFAATLRLFMRFWGALTLRFDVRRPGGNLRCALLATPGPLFVPALSALASGWHIGATSCSCATASLAAACSSPVLLDAPSRAQTASHSDGSSPSFFGECFGATSCSKAFSKSSSVGPHSSTFGSGTSSCRSSVSCRRKASQEAARCCAVSDVAANSARACASPCDERPARSVALAVSRRRAA